MKIFAELGFPGCLIAVEGFDGFERRYSGRVETGEDSYSDPYMGRVV